MKLLWKWKNYSSEIRLFDLQGIQIGFIKDFNSISKIGDKKFKIEKQGLIGQFCYIVDPSDNKAYCEYMSESKFTGTSEIYFASPLYKRHFVYDSKHYCYINEEKNFIIDLHKDKGWFTKTGQIYINTTNNDWELLAYCILYGLYVKTHELNSSD